MRIEGMSLADGMTSVRLAERFDLLQQLDAHFARGRAQRRGARVGSHAPEGLRRAALRSEPRGLRSGARIRRAARRLWTAQIRPERAARAAARRSGLRLVQVNWPREAGDESIGSPLWDTHRNNARPSCATCSARNSTAPSPRSSPISPARGLLDETLVVVMGEFGRSPKINAAGGRDHWGSCFSVALAGAGSAAGRSSARATARRLSGGAPGPSAGPRRHHLPPPRHRPAPRVPRSPPAPARGDQRRHPAGGSGGHLRGAPRSSVTMLAFGNPLMSEVPFHMEGVPARPPTILIPSSAGGSGCALD